MIKLPLSFGKWNKLKKALEFSESNVKSVCIGDSILKLKSCINDCFNQIRHKEVSHKKNEKQKKTTKKQTNRDIIKYLWKTFERGLPESCTILTNWYVSIS